MCAECSYSPACVSLPALRVAFLKVMAKVPPAPATALTPCSQEISAGCRTVVLGFCATAGFPVAAASSAFLTPSPARPRTGCLSSRQCALLYSGLAQHRPPRAKANTPRRASSSQRRQLARDDPGAPEMPPTWKRLLSHHSCSSQGQQPGTVKAQPCPCRCSHTRLT